MHHHIFRKIHTFFINCVLVAICFTTLDRKSKCSKAYRMLSQRFQVPKTQHYVKFNVQQNGYLSFFIFFYFPIKIQNVGFLWKIPLKSRLWIIPKPDFMLQRCIQGLKAVALFLAAQLQNSKGESVFWNAIFVISDKHYRHQWNTSRKF